MSIIQDLVSLGFSADEANVYLELLKLGEANAGPIIKATGLHRQLVYRALETLNSRGLVIEVLQRGKKVFSAADPSQIMSLETERLRIVQRALPPLNKLRSHSEEPFQVRVLTGIEEFRKNIHQQLRLAAEDDRIVRIIGGAQSSLAYDAIGDWYTEYRELTETLKIKKRLLAPSKEAKAFVKRFKTESNSELRTLDFGLSAPTYTRIIKSMVSIEILAKEILVVQIQNEQIAAGYIEHFELLWKSAKKQPLTD